MIRRRIRDRRRYLYSKSVEASQRALFEKKGRIRAVLEEGNPIPTELRNEEHELRRQIDLEDQEPRGACCSRTPAPSHGFFFARASGMQCPCSFTFVCTEICLTMCCPVVLLFGSVIGCYSPKSMVDNEYATASVREPKILLTTSRNPSAPLTQFVKVFLLS